MGDGHMHVQYDLVLSNVHISNYMYVFGFSEEEEYEEDMEEEAVIEDETKKKAERKSMDKYVNLSLAVNKVIAKWKERKQNPLSPEEVTEPRKKLSFKDAAEKVIQGNKRHTIGNKGSKREIVEVVREYLSIMKGEQLSAQSPPKAQGSQPKKYTETSI